MRHYKLNIKNVVYRVLNDSTYNLPTSFNNVCVEMDEDKLALSDDKKKDFLFMNAAGMFILNTTGYTPENFTYEVKPL